MISLRFILIVFLVGFAPAVTAQQGSDARNGMPPVEDFVRAPGFHGFSYEGAALYGPEDVQPLIRMLKDPVEEQFWTGAVWVLGIIGSDEAVDALIAFHETGVQGTPSPAALQALLLVPQALGFAAEDEDSRAFAWLREAIDAREGGKAITWTGKGWAPGSREVLIAKLAVNGIGLAGNEAGRQLLKETESRMDREDPDRLRYLAPNIVEAEAMSLRIAAEGRARALRRPEAKSGRDLRPKQPTIDEPAQSTRP